MTTDSVGLLLGNLSPRPYCVGKLLEDLDRHVPADTCVGDADALLESRWSFGGHLLVALTDVGLDHHTNNGSLPFPDLITNHLGDLGLIAMVLVGVA